MTDRIIIPGERNTEGSGFLVGAIMFVIITLLFIFYGLPALRRATLTSAPEAATQGPTVENEVGGSINFPDEFNVDMNQLEE